MSIFRDPFNDPTEIDILGIILIMAGTFLSAAGFQGIYDLYRIGVHEGADREVLMRIGFIGIVSIILGIALFIHTRLRRSSDILDEDQFSGKK